MRCLVTVLSHEPALHTSRYLDRRVSSLAPRTKQQMPRHATPGPQPPRASHCTPTMQIANFTDTCFCLLKVGYVMMLKFAFKMDYRIVTYAFYVTDDRGNLELAQDFFRPFFTTDNWIEIPFCSANAFNTFYRDHRLRISQLSL